MSRISKADAREIARKLTDKKQKAISALQAELSKLAYDVVRRALKPEIEAAFKKYPSFFNTSPRIALVGHGLNFDEVSLPSALPCTHADWRIVHECNKVTADQFSALIREIKTSKQKLEKLVVEIEHSLIGLGTYKRIEEEFPEAAQFLPVKMSTELTVNISGIRKELQKTD